MRTLMSAPPTSRVGRYPKHTFNTRELPYTAQPFLIAPVLPGETMESVYFETRVLTDPIRNPLIGWKKEYYFFYVKVTDLLNDAIRDMFVDPTNTDLMASLGVAAQDTPYYQPKGGIDYLERSTQAIAKWWFWDQDDTPTYTAYGIPIVQIRESLFLDSLTDKDDMPEGANIATATDAGDLERVMLAFEHLRAMGVANMSYEDFLRSYGISILAKDEGKPELLGRFSEFQYPSNTVNPIDGTAASAVSWVFKNSLRERKFFKEPGFVVGISVTRPKVYLSGLSGYASAFLSRAWDWMPNYLEQAPMTGLKYFTGDTGPLGDRTTAPDHYWLDMRDLFIHGDQFQNHTAFAAVPAVSGANHMIPLPDGSTFNWKYMSEAQAKEFFVTPASAFYVKQDGFASFSIKGKQVDYTQTSVAAA